MESGGRFAALPICPFVPPIGAKIANIFATQDKPVYGVLMKTLANPFWDAMERGVKPGAEAAGVEYYLQAVESDHAAEP